MSASVLAGGIICIILLSFWSTFAMVRENRDRARDSFHQMRTAVRETEEARRQLESNIESLRTQVDAVRLQARNEFRLILPGERIEVFSINESTTPDERVLSTTFP